MISLILGIVAGILCTISFLPQLIKIFQTKRAEDLSLITFVVLSIGVLLWLVYGILIRELPIILANATMFVLSLLIVTMKIRYSKSFSSKGCIQQQKYITSQEMQEIDKLAQEKFGISAIVLMENAGRAAFQIALNMLSKEVNKKVICVCGKGNNAGDGFVCARHLINNGVDVDVFLLGNPEKLKENAKINYKILENMGMVIKILEHKEDFCSFESELKKTGLIIDAIFGIGLSGEIKEPYKRVIELINESKKPILAIDVPSGLEATEGKTLGACIKAAKTITFAFPKTGFVKNDGPLYSGELIIADISIPKRT